MNFAALQLPRSSTASSIEMSNFIKIVDFLRERQTQISPPQLNEYSNKSFILQSQFQLKVRLPAIVRQYTASPNNRVVAVQLVNNQVLICSESKILLVYPQRTIIEVPDVKFLKKLRHG